MLEDIKEVGGQNPNFNALIKKNRTLRGGKRLFTISCTLFANEADSTTLRHFPFYYCSYTEKVSQSALRTEVTQKCPKEIKLSRTRLKLFIGMYKITNLLDIHISFSERSQQIYKIKYRSKSINTKLFEIIQTCMFIKCNVEVPLDWK